MEALAIIAILVLMLMCVRYWLPLLILLIVVTSVCSPSTSHAAVYAPQSTVIVHRSDDSTGDE